ncbi:prepilin peptidase [Wukongibacter baidiensis]|uniref:A24 family peptidase n=1 Tax=Wukongibacter baidiensis TaxID=1723361 RepID=UPI003D7F29D8
MISIILKYVELALLLILALISDIKTYKIKNNIVYPFILIGLITNMYLEGLDGLVFAIKGMIIPIVILIIFFALRMLGAGDIKLFSAIGAIMGIDFALKAIIYSFLAGGAIALLLIILRRNGVERLKHLFIYLKNCLITFSLLPYTDFNDKSDGGKFRFAFAIVCGVGINLFLHIT